MQTSEKIGVFEIGKVLFLFLLTLLLATSMVTLSGCTGGSHSSSSKSKYTQEELRDAHELYELREQMKEDK